MSCIVEVTKRYKELDLIDREREKLWMEVCNTTGGSDQNHSSKRENQKGKMFVRRGLILLLVCRFHRHWAQSSESTEKVAKHGQHWTGLGQSPGPTVSSFRIFTTSAIWETHIECSTSFFFFFACSTLTASYFRIWNSLTGIPSPPLALLVAMLPKAHLTSHSIMAGSRWVITPSWFSGSLSPFFVQFFCVFLHLFLSSPSVRSILFLSFIRPSLRKMFPWYL